MFGTRTVPARAGAGLKPAHYDAIFSSRPDIGFFEIHAENYMGAGGLPHRMLSAIRERYALSVHGVGLSIGAEGPLDRTHLLRFKEVVDRYRPGLVSEHLAWSTHDTVYFNDLLPVPYTETVLARVADHVDEVQQALGRQILMENPSTYVAFTQSEMPEIEFVAEMQRRTGCGLLLDVNNVHVSATNHRYDARAYLADFPYAHVGEIHLGGHAEDSDDDGNVLLIDAHDREVADPVWALYKDVIERAGARPTLIEWDNDVPGWDVLFDDVKRAEIVLAGKRARSDAA